MASIVLFFVSAAIAQTEAPTLSAQVDELFSEWNRDDAAGAAVAVIQNGRIIYEKAFGMADLERVTFQKRRR